MYILVNQLKHTELIISLKPRLDSKNTVYSLLVKLETMANYLLNACYTGMPHLAEALCVV